MKIVAISDVHIKEAGDQAEKLILEFFHHPVVQNADHIFLLGDIFDLVIGPHSQYFRRFPVFFHAVADLLKKDKSVYYVEGNHDFHLRRLFESFFKVYPEVPRNKFNLSPEFVIQNGGKTVHLAHGDDMEIDNLGYKIFKGIVTSAPLTFYANYLMPYFLIKSVGETASKISRNRNNKRYTKSVDLTKVEEKFRRSVEMFHKKKNCDVYVCGHSHVKDHYQSINGFEYINNGYAQFSKTFILIDNGVLSFVPLA